VITRIHVNQHVIKQNRKTGRRDPVLTVKTYKTNEYYKEVVIDGPCRVVYSPDKPLSCGAQVWIETNSEVKGVTDEGRSMDDCNRDFEVNCGTLAGKVLMYGKAITLSERGESC